MTNYEWIMGMNETTLAWLLSSDNLLVHIIRNWASEQNIHIRDNWWQYDHMPYEDVIELWLSSEYKPFPGKEVVDEEV